MICGNCGADNAQESEYCRKCGHAFGTRLIVRDAVCAHHPGRIATSACFLCGLELCEECERFVDDVTYCEGCAGTTGEVVEICCEGEDAPATQETLAPFSWRLVAGMLDAAVIICGGVALAVLLWFVSGSPWVPMDPKQPLFGAYWLIVCGGTAAYFAGFVAASGQTPGMAVLDLAIVRADGGMPGWKEGIVRFFASIASVMLIFGMFMPLWDPKRRALHDKIARTVMVKVG